MPGDRRFESGKEASSAPTTVMRRTYGVRPPAVHGAIAPHSPRGRTVVITLPDGSDDHASTSTSARQVITADGP